MFHGRISLSSMLVLMLVNFVHQFSLELIYIYIYIYIYHRKYQIKYHSCPWCSAACAPEIVHRNHFFQLYQQNKSAEIKAKFTQANNHCKRVLEATKPVYAIKTKESITYQKLCYQDFWQIANSVLNKGKSDISPLFNSPEVLSSASDKVKLFTKNFSKKSKFDDLGFPLPVLPSKTNLKLDNNPVTSKMVEKGIMNLHSSKASDPDCISVVVLQK